MFSNKKKVDYEMIFAMDPEGCIGYNESLPWPKHKRDMRWFYDITFNKNVIMGRRTFDSLPKPYLKHRHLWILSENLDPFNHEYGSEKASVSIVNNVCDLPVTGIVAGGSAIYDLLFEKVNTAYITKMKESCRCDTYIRLSILDELDTWQKGYQVIEESCEFLKLRRPK